MPKKIASIVSTARRGRPASADRGEAGYHHGDLQEALIAATERILADVGADGFTLREAARRAGVSPAAPSHHFGNAPGLLTEVAIRGYGDLGEALKQARLQRGSVRQRLHAQGLAYLDFALTYPGRFQMMFSNKRLVEGDERLRKAARDAHREFEMVLEELMADDPHATPRLVKVASTAAWSTVHGFAKLALEDKFGATDTGAGRKDVVAMLRQVLEYQWPTRGPDRKPGRKP